MTAIECITRNTIINLDMCGRKNKQKDTIQWDRLTFITETYLSMNFNDHNNIQYLIMDGRLEELKCNIVDTLEVVA